MNLLRECNDIGVHIMRNFSNLVGGTPLIPISPGIYGKLETYNPTGSVKDRVVSYLVSKALVAGEVRGDTILCEATSGNTGISLSAVAASLGLECKIFMPSNMSIERKRMMTSFGAEVIYSDENDFSGAIGMRDDFLASNNAWSPRQFSNLDNVLCHKSTTAPEIHADVCKAKKRWSAFIHGAGTGGTIEGVRQYLRQSGMDTKVCIVHPAESPHGIQGIADGKDFLAKPGNMDAVLKVPTADAIARAKMFVKETGILVGISSGANIIASEIWRKSNPVSEGEAIVTMLCDRGERYMSVYEVST